MADPFTSRGTFKYIHFAAGAQTNVQIKSGPGMCRLVIVGTSGATPGVITILDNTATGGVLGQTSNPITILTPVASAAPVYVELDVGFNTGLTINNTGTTSDVTVSYI